MLISPPNEIPSQNYSIKIILHDESRIDDIESHDNTHFEPTRLPNVPLDGYDIPRDSTIDFQDEQHNSLNGFVLILKRLETLQYEVIMEYKKVQLELELGWTDCKEEVLPTINNTYNEVKSTIKDDLLPAFKTSMTEVKDTFLQEMFPTFKETYNDLRKFLISEMPLPSSNR